jgi:hypothetical protein
VVLIKLLELGCMATLKSSTCIGPYIVPFSRNLHGAWMHIAIYFRCRKTVHFCIIRNGLCSLNTISMWRW